MSVTYTIAAHPTVYRGITFRSRLEAKWAAFFDAAKWKWEYEPLDLNGWVPDFVLFGERWDVPNKQIFVEIKPIFALDHDVMAKMQEAAPFSPAEDGESAGWDAQPHYLLLLGAAPHLDADLPHLGWLHDGDAVAEATIGWWSAINTFGICHRDNWFGDIISGWYDGGHPGDRHAEGVAAARQSWAHAGNATQWKPR